MEIAMILRPLLAERLPDNLTDLKADDRRPDLLGGGVRAIATIRSTPSVYAGRRLADIGGSNAPSVHAGQFRLGEAPQGLAVQDELGLQR
jgi:hypothetical protein